MRSKTEMMVVVRPMLNRKRLRARMLISLATAIRPVAVAAFRGVLFWMRLRRRMLFANHCTWGSAAAHEVLIDKAQQK